jgi:hypothetical protein
MDRRKKRAARNFIHIKYLEGSSPKEWTRVRRRNHVREEKPSTRGDAGVSAITPVSANVLENAAVIAPSSHPPFSLTRPRIRDSTGANNADTRRPLRSED